MKNRIVVLGALCAAGLLLNGCAVRRYTVVKDRVDQDLSSGNSGYLAGSQPKDMEPLERQLTRKTYVTEVELPIFTKKKKKVVTKSASGQESVQEPAATAVTEDSESAEIRGKEALTVTDTRAAQPVTFEDYKVQKGDTLEKIAKNKLGKSKYWVKIYDANKAALRGADRIYPGQTIKIPKEPMKEPKGNLK